MSDVTAAEKNLAKTAGSPVAMAGLAVAGLAVAGPAVAGLVVGLAVAGLVVAGLAVAGLAMVLAELTVAYRQDWRRWWREDSACGGRRQRLRTAQLSCHTSCHPLVHALPGNGSHRR